MFNETQIKDNWNELISVINKNFSGERQDLILQLHKHFENRMMFTPASTREHYHNAFPGGYVAHVLNVVKFSAELKKMWESQGAKINFSDEELAFSSIFHDLGKVGDIDNDYYIPNTSEWHRKVQGKIYSFNSVPQYMKVYDRTVSLLLKFRIPCSDTELISIKLADGLFEDGNEGYLSPYDEGYVSKTNMPYILHQADYMASKIEYDMWQLEMDKKSGKASPIKQKKDVAVDNKFDADAFDKLFKG